MRYTLHDRIVQGLLVLEDHELRRVHGIIEWVASQPMQCAQGSSVDPRGRAVLFHRVDALELVYYVARNGRVVFTDLRSAS